MTVHQMDILDQTGHSTHGWDPDNEVEVATAKAAFDAATSRGYQAFRVVEGKDGEPGKKGTRMTAFDPDAEKMMLLPQLQGG